MNNTHRIAKLIREIEQRYSVYKSQKKKLFVSSSFQTHSIPLLHILTSIDPEIPVYFLNTGFHFPETHLYVREISELLSINVKFLTSPIPKSQQKDAMGQFLFCSNPNRCCDINKVEPLEPILMKNDVWITGVRADQNKNRASMGYEAKGPFDTLRFHPMIEWTGKDIYEYRKLHELPAHPLEAQGYLSVGCEPCTETYIGDDRAGRWKGMSKNECGLHTELVEKG